MLLRKTQLTKIQTMPQGKSQGKMAFWYKALIIATMDHFFSYTYFNTLV